MRLVCGLLRFGVTEMGEKPIPRMMRVEHCERDSRTAMIAGERTSSYRDWTVADVMTPMGEIHVRLPGYHCERRLYQPLFDAAMDQAWLNFCTADSFAMVR